MSELFAPVCSIAPTRRRRFLWAAWWTGPPSRDPFRKPDAFHGGARSRAEALANAEEAAGAHLIEIEPRWARAWGRVLIGQAPWIESKVRREASDPEARDAPTAGPSGMRPAREEPGAPRASIWAILGVDARVTPADLKRAFRKRAIEVHPDCGGTAEAFRDLQRAYEEAQRRIARPRRRGA